MSVHTFNLFINDVIICVSVSVYTFNLLFLIEQESTVKKTWMNVCQTLAKMVVFVRICLGITPAIAPLMTFLGHFMEETTVLKFS